VNLPDQGALTNLNQGLVQSTAPIPETSTGQATVPSNLRISSKKDFAPRTGLAYRIGKDNTTVLRGGYGSFIETLLSATAING
jgi:hypothetical protein